MCLFIKNTKGVNTDSEAFKEYKIVAKEDKVCYKLLFDDFASVCEYFQYEKNFIYYQDEKKPIDRFTFKFYNLTIGISKGLHSYSTLNFARNSLLSGDIIVECIIPKGAIYFEGNQGDIVSDQLLITDKIVHTY